MFDVVWIKVNLKNCPNGVSKVQYVMFGAGGITRFEPNETGSNLISHNDRFPIEESPEYLMKVLGKIRRTAGVVNEQESEEREEEESQGSASASEAESSL